MKRMHEIMGQDRAVEMLQTALAGGRLHHGFVFHGPAGVGKFTTAVALAQVLLCHEPQTELTGRTVACGSCASCRLFASPGAAHPDLHVVNKEMARHSSDARIRAQKQIRIPTEVVREFLIDRVGGAAQLGHHKVFILDEAELLNQQGQNVLLKTLEEPPPGTYLILVTANEDGLLPTIRSRCVRVGFVPLPDEVILRRLDESDRTFNEADRRWLVSFSEGSLGRLALALQYDLLVWGHMVHDAVVAMNRGSYPADFGQRMQEAIDAFAKVREKETENASKEAANKLGGALMLAIIARAARQMLVTTASKGGLDTAGLERRLMPWVRVIEIVRQAEAEFNANVNMGLVTDHLASLMYRAVSGEELVLSGAV